MYSEKNVICQRICTFLKDFAHLWRRNLWYTIRCIYKEDFPEKGRDSLEPVELIMNTNGRTCLFEEVPKE